MRILFFIFCTLITNTVSCQKRDFFYIEKAHDSLFIQNKVIYLYDIKIDTFYFNINNFNQNDQELFDSLISWYEKMPAVNKIEIIKELFKYEGDTRFFSSKVKRYNRSISTKAPNDMYYSIQVRALFLINVFYFGKAFRNYSPIPLISNKKESKTYSIGGRKIKKTWKKYKKWLNIIIQNGIENIDYRNHLPLDQNCCSKEWYGTTGLSYVPGLEYKD